MKRRQKYLEGMGNTKEGKPSKLTSPVQTWHCSSLHRTGLNQMGPRAERSICKPPSPTQKLSAIVNPSQRKTRFPPTESHCVCKPLLIKQTQWHFGKFFFSLTSLLHIYYGFQFGGHYGISVGANVCVCLRLYVLFVLLILLFLLLICFVWFWCICFYLSYYIIFRYLFYKQREKERVLIWVGWGKPRRSWERETLIRIYWVKKVYFQ